MNMLHNDLTLWARVGDAGDYQAFDNIGEVTEYFNELGIGLVTGWINAGPGVGFETNIFHGQDFVSCYWGDEKADLVRALNPWERAYVEYRNLDDATMFSIEDSTEA